MKVLVASQLVLVDGLFVLLGTFSSMYTFWAGLAHTRYPCSAQERSKPAESKSSQQGLTGGVHCDLTVWVYNMTEQEVGRLSMPMSSCFPQESRAGKIEPQVSSTKIPWQLDGELDCRLVIVTEIDDLSASLHADTIEVGWMTNLRGVLNGNGTLLDRRYAYLCC